MKPLACGHAPSVTSFGTGYARLGRGRTLNGKRIRSGGRVCYECADALQRQDMERKDVIGAYLSSDGRSVTTWTGGVLARVVHLSTSRSGWHRSTITAVSAVDPSGARWYGRNAGPGMCITLRRAK